MLVVQTEKRQQDSLQRSIASELEWVNTNAKGQQKKGKARMRRYDDLTKQVMPLLLDTLSLVPSMQNANLVQSHMLPHVVQGLTVQSRWSSTTEAVKASHCELHRRMSPQKLRLSYAYRHSDRHLNTRSLKNGCAFMQSHHTVCRFHALQQRQVPTLTESPMFDSLHDDVHTLYTAD